MTARTVCGHPVKTAERERQKREREEAKAAKANGAGSPAARATAGGKEPAKRPSRVGKSGGGASFFNR